MHPADRCIGAHLTPPKKKAAHPKVRGFFVTSGLTPGVIDRASSPVGAAALLTSWS
ncbi:hypothetical protein LUTEI9C_70407 [Luteimonas sp. 9C]|nr:hypothetical protein LUTEI9C_70407 [Luteimonas sp. 9C]